MNGYRTDASTFVPQLSGQTGLESSVEAGFDVHLRPEVRSHPHADNAGVVPVPSGLRIVYCHAWADDGIAGGRAIPKPPGYDRRMDRVNVGNSPLARTNRKTV